MTIKRVDLSRDYIKHKKEYMDAIEKVCNETSFSGGKYSDKFAKEFSEFCNVKYATGVNNGTSALHCAMIALGIGAGDEVIVPANTYIATAWAVSYVGAKPVFVDCTKDTWEIDPSKIENLITNKTKAIIGVHLYGQPFDFDEVKKIADKHNLYVVEDCAQAHNAEYKGKKVGGLGEIGCWSFYPGKNLYAFGEGGCVTTNNKKYYDLISIIKNQGGIVPYYHTNIGYNYRLEGMMGAVLSVSLKYLNEWTERRRMIGNRYEKEIKNDLFTFQSHPNNTKPVYHLFEMKVNNPDRFIEYMKDLGIECTRHYPVPCHLQEVYKDLGYKEGDFPNAEELAKHCVDLPLFPEMTDEEIERVVVACNNYR